MNTSDTGDTTRSGSTLWKHEPDLESMTRRVEGSMCDRLGIRVVEAGPDYLRATMPVAAPTRQPFGRLHGGASCVLAEEVGSLASWLCLDDHDSQLAVGIEINANHLRGKTEGTVTATARPLHVGRSTHVWDVRIEDERGKLVCVSRLTVAVIPKP